MSKLQESVSQYSYTENGALTHSTSGSACLDLFARLGAMRDAEESEVFKLIDLAFNENPITCLQVLLYLRDCRGGQGERRVFRLGMKYLAQDRKSIDLDQLYYEVEKYGRFDDLFNILPATLAADVIDKHFKSHMAEGKGTLLEKWMPSIGGGKNKYAEELAKCMGFTPKQYRTNLSKLRSTLKLVESSMCKNDWSSIVYEHVPSKAMLNYNDAFSHHDFKRYQEYMKSVASGKTKIHSSQLYPYEIIKNRHKDNADALWNALPDYTDGRNAIVVCDTSGSMYTGTRVQPIEVSTSLALYFAERNKGIFHNEVIVFSEQPEWTKINGSTLNEKYKSLPMINAYNTNLQSVFSLILKAAVDNAIPEEEMPSTIYIISDMEFDEACSSNDRTNYDLIKLKYESAGYLIPTVVFWNVNSRHDNLAVSATTPNTLLVSGSSSTTFKIATTPGLTPVQAMYDTLLPYEESAKSLLHKLDGV